MAKPKLAVWKFASCDGCQLTLLNCEDELIPLAGQVEIAYFPEATRAVVEGPYDVSLVEGSITTPDDLERIQDIRAASHRLITIGACATSGGIQALRNFADVEEFRSVVYAHPEYVETLDRSTPIAAHVSVDFELRGCPIDKDQLLEVLAAELQGRRPRISKHSVCFECKRRGNVCVTVAHGTPCLGPVTQAGCGALCPSFDRGCYGCFGPQDTPNAASLTSRLREHGMDASQVLRVYRTFNAASEVFLRASEQAEAAGVTEGGGPMNHKLTDGGHVMHVGNLARVEGEGAMHIELRDGRVTDVQLQIYEPPRFYEAFLRGRAWTEPPDITARICGICPVAYQMSACWAIEDACGVTVPEAIGLMRRLLYCGEWIESHALHVFLLHAPDFLGYDGAIELAADHPSVVETGLRLKKAGNRLMTVVGGRSIHPVNVRVGGFHRMPRVSELRALRPTLEQALDDALATVRLVSGFEFPDMEQPYEYVALRPDTGYPIEAGRVVTSLGNGFEVRDFQAHVAEFQVPHSHALHARLDGGARGPYVVGPLARYTLNHDRLGGPAREAAREAGLGAECRNPFRSIVVRAVELVEAVAEALRIIDAWKDGVAPAIPVPPRAGEGFGASEAPRGILFHRYVLDDDGIIRDAQIVPPTSQNQAGIEADLRALVETWTDLDDHALQHRCEHAIRNYDPCISCATHFLDLTVDRS